MAIIIGTIMIVPGIGVVSAASMGRGSDTSPRGPRKRTRILEGEVGVAYMHYRVVR